MFHTTYRLLRENHACKDRYVLFHKSATTLGYNGDTTPIPLTVALETNGLDDALWALRAVLPEEEKTRDRLARLLACDYAEHVLPMFEKHYPTDKRPKMAMEVARRYALGNASKEELSAAWAAAWAAAGDTAGAAVWAAAGNAAGAAAWAAAGDAAGAAVWAAAGAADWAAAGAADWAAEQAWQREQFIAMLNEKEA